MLQTSVRTGLLLELTEEAEQKMVSNNKDQKIIKLENGQQNNEQLLLILFLLLIQQLKKRVAALNKIDNAKTRQQHLLAP